MEGKQTAKTVNRILRVVISIKEVYIRNYGMKTSLQFSDVKVALATLLVGTSFRFDYQSTFENHPLLAVDTLAVNTIGH